MWRGLVDLMVENFQLNHDNLSWEDVRALERFKAWAVRRTWLRMTVLLLEVQRQDRLVGMLE